MFRRKPQSTPQVRCAKCGFLSLRNQFTGALDEAPSEYREDGQVPKLHKTGLPHVVSLMESLHEFPYTGVPICLVQAYPLIDEVEYREGRIVPEAIKSIVSKERQCDDHTFTDWQQGFTPKEHLEMKERHQLQEWQADLQKQLVQSQNATQIRTAVIAAVFLILGVALTAALGQWLK